MKMMNLSLTQFMEKDDTFCFFIFKINTYYGFHIPDLFEIREFSVKQA